MGGEEKKGGSYKEQRVTDPDIDSATLWKEETSDIPGALYNRKREFKRESSFGGHTVSSP